jgi:hypothetical protein
MKKTILILLILITKFSFAQDTLKIIKTEKYFCREELYDSFALHKLFKVAGGVPPYTYTWEILPYDNLGGFCKNIYNLKGKKLTDKQLRDSFYFSTLIYCDVRLVLNVVDSNENSVEDTLNVIGSFPYYLLELEPITIEKKLGDSIKVSDYFINRKNKYRSKFSTQYDSTAFDVFPIENEKNAFWFVIKKEGGYCIIENYEDTICSNKETYQICYSVKPSSINSNKQYKLNFNIFPNPANSILTINLDFIPVRNFNLEIINANVVNVVNKNINSLSTQINVNNLPNGVYSCILKGENYNLIKKLIINH